MRKRKGEIALGYLIALAIIALFAVFFTPGGKPEVVKGIRIDNVPLVPIDNGAEGKEVGK